MWKDDSHNQLEQNANSYKLKLLHSIMDLMLKQLHKRENSRILFLILSTLVKLLLQLDQKVYFHSSIYCAILTQ